MDPLHLLILLGAGLAAGFVAGLIGVGGGVIFAPVLFFYFQAIGIPESVIAPLTIGSSLFCTLLAAVASAWTQYSKTAVITRVALTVGLFSALAVFLTTRYITTQPWYDGDIFQIVFSLVLLSVVARMVIRQPGTGALAESAAATAPAADPTTTAAAYPAATDSAAAGDADPIANADAGLAAPAAADAAAAGANDPIAGHPADPAGAAMAAHASGDRHGWPALAGAGSVAGAVSAAAGVGGGVVLVPAYSHFMGLPIRVATGTSSATIVIISLVGVSNYVLHGWGAVDLVGAVGYVDVVRGLVIAVPSLLTANLGVRLAHRINQRTLRMSFAGIAALVALRLLLEGLSP